MTIFWISILWLAAAIVLGVLMGRAIALASDGQLARGRAHRVRGAPIPGRTASPELRLIAHRHRRSPRPPHLFCAFAALLLLGACAAPASDEPHVTSSSGSNATVEYSGERTPEADAKAQEACARNGKRAGRASTSAGATGGSVRSYECMN